MTVPELLATLPAWLGLGAGGGVGFFMIRWFFEWLGGRVDKREAAADRAFARLDAGTQALIDHLQGQITRQAEQISRLIERADHLENELEECRRRDAEKEAEIMRLRALLQGLGDARQAAQTIIAAERIEDRKTS